VPNTDRATNDALAYPEPPASPLWHRHGAKARPLTAAQQKRNRELLNIAQHKPRHPDVGVRAMFSDVISP
jgi:hypothetical protein